MKYNVIGENTITFVVRVGATEKSIGETRRVELKGNGSLEKDVAEKVLELKQTRNLVVEGALRFPESEEMEKMFDAQGQARKERLARLSAIQEEKREKAAANSGDVKSLQDQLAAQQKQNDALMARLEALEKGKK